MLICNSRISLPEAIFFVYSCIVKNYTSAMQGKIGLHELATLHTIIVKKLFTICVAYRNLAS